LINPVVYGYVPLHFKAYKTSDTFYTRILLYSNIRAYKTGAEAIFDMTI